jgi:two-component system nitrogen regulation response regulator NtrX
MKILLVDDEKNILDSVGGALKRSGYEIVTAASVAEALAKCDNLIDVAILDVWLTDGDGIELLKKIKSEYRDIVLVMISGHSTIATAVEAVKHGAYDFLEKPLSLDKLEVVLHNIKELLSLKKQRDDLLTIIEGEHQLIGESEAMAKLRETILRFAPETAPVLITGESGTGKELVARLLHQNSAAGNYPFVAVNCAALPNELAEAELFGYEKGAFTGAVQTHPGHLRRAGEGIIFLDEITEASLSLQAKLLRVIEYKKVTPLGGKAEYQIKARIITASNKNIENEIDAGKFRKDLYFRLNVLPIYVPSLRERIGDIKILVDHFCRQYAHRSNKKPRRISQSGIAFLESLNYPGNVRELKNYVERIMIMTEGDAIDSEQIKQVLPLAIGGDIKAGSGLKQAVEEYERKYILDTLKGANNNMALTARALGIERSHLYKKMKALGIEKPDREDDS